MPGCREALLGTASPMMFVDALNSHVEAVLATGVEPPPEWTELYQRLHDFLSAPSSIPQRLTDAVITGTGDVAALCAMALAEATALPPAHAQVDNAVKSVVLQRLKDIYAPVALDNYRTVPTEFDSLATKFVAAANVIDPETPAEHLVHAPEKLRKAWSTAEQLGHQLSETMTALAAAAALNGIPCPRDEHLIALTVDANDLHRRRVWEAWSSTGGRCGRWAALIALGATIKAHDLDNFEPYRQPQPMTIKQIQVGRGVHRSGTILKTMRLSTRTGSLRLCES